METPPINAKKSLLSSLTKTSLTPCRRVGLSRVSSGSLKKPFRNVPSSTSLQSQGTPKLESCSVTGERLGVESILVSEELGKVGIKCGGLYNKSTATKVRRCLPVGSNSTPLANKCAPELCTKNKPKGRRLSDDFESGIKSGVHNEVSNPVKKSKLSLKGKGNDENDRPSEILKEQLVKSENSRVESSCLLLTDHLKPEQSTHSEQLHDKEVTADLIEKLISSITEKKIKLDKLKVQETYAKKHNLEELRAHTDRWRAAGQEALRFSTKLAKQAGIDVTVKQLMDQHGFSAQLMQYNEEEDEFN